MPDDGSAQPVSVWPIAKFYFSVKIGNLISSFQEISGLDTEAQIIDYRHGDSPIFSNQKMPGLVKFSNITLKKGIFKDGKAFQDLLNKSTMNTFVRQTVVISLLDEDNKVTMKWTLQNAFVKKITATDLNSAANEVLVETMELAHEGMTIG